MESRNQKPDPLAWVPRSNQKSRNFGFWFVVSISEFLILNSPLFAVQTRWSGVDESVVERVAEEHGRHAWTPFINGDLLLFVFLLAGVVGGFLLGFYFRKLFVEKYDK